MKQLKRDCPICKSVDADILHSQSFVLPDNSPLPKNYNIACCKSCGFVFADTPSDQTTYNEYYKLLSKYEDLKTSTGGGLNQYDQERLLSTVEVIQRFLPDKDSTILDLGCANGGLLKILKSLNYSKILGVDPSIVCVNNVRFDGIRCFEGDIFSDSFLEINEKFNCIILTHVIEHIYDLQRAVLNISEKLIEDGILYIEVPDSSRYSDFYTVPFYYIDCEHINHFDENSLVNLFTTNGFRECESHQIEFNVSSIHKYPAVYSVFRKAKTDRLKNIPYSAGAKNSFIKFLEQSKNQNENDRLIAQLVATQEPIVIWGAGQFTLRLLANSSLAKCNIQGFVDSDSNKQGKKLLGLSIHTPDFLANNPYTVVICSALHHEEIGNTVNALNITRPIHKMK